MAGDIVKQLKDTRYPGQMEMRLQAAEIIEQYRADQQSDEQTNNELRAQRDALVRALTLAEDILSRAPFSNALWPNGMHPMTGITQIRDALALVGSPKP